jgi:glycosyltransferase involved in cell wall biosynthesis
MKIGIEVQRLFRTRKFGIETSSLELIKALRDLEPRHEFVVFASDGADKACITDSNNIKVQQVAGRLFVDFEQFYLPVAAGREQIDVLHCTGNTTPFFSPAPIVQTLHDVIFMDRISSEDSWYQRFGNHYRRRVVPLVTPRSKAVITVSRYEKERIIDRLGISPERIHVVYNGLNNRRFHNKFTEDRRQQVRTKYLLPEHYILFLGNEATRKNAVRVIEAYLAYAGQTTQPLPLVTPGLSEKFLSQKLMALGQVSRRPLFHTPGYIHDDDLPVIYNMAHMFLFPSLSEGFGMPLVEAMACGTPVITSSTSCLPEIAGNAAILVNPLKSDEIASGIFKYINDEAFRQSKIAAGLRNAKRFDWKYAAETVLNLYESVLTESQATQRQPNFLERYIFATKHQP